MSKLVFILFVAFAFSIHNYECAKTKVKPQVKMTRAQLWYANEKYVNALTYKMTKRNGTYNDLGLHFELKEDLPEDILVETKVYLTDEKGERQKLIVDDVTSVCNESKNRELLPKIVVVGKADLGKPCLKKGVYDMKDMGQFRFEILIPDLPNQGQRYRADYRFGTANETINYSTFWSQWGYLKK